MCLKEQMGVIAYVCFVKGFASPFQTFSLVCSESEVGEYPRKVTEVHWKCAADFLHTKNAQCSN